MSASEKPIVLDDTMMYVLFDRVRRAQRQGRRATKAELLKDLDAETEERRAQKQASDLLQNPDALKDLIRLYCETTGVVELTAHARAINGQIAVELTERH